MLDDGSALLIALTGYPLIRTIMPLIRQSRPNLATILTALLLVAACQSAPVQEMSDARQAISVAQEAGAAEHAPADFKAAVDYLESAERHLNDRRYKNARHDATQAKIKALEALQQSEGASDASP